MIEFAKLRRGGIVAPTTTAAPAPNISARLDTLIGNILVTFARLNRANGLVQPENSVRPGGSAVRVRV
jgi:hypothetical protein